MKFDMRLNMKQNQLFLITPLMLALSAAWPALAADLPDAGRLLQENAPQIEAPRVSPEISIEAPAPSAVVPGGISVTLQSITISGNTLYDAATLTAVLGDVIGKSYDLAGFKQLANQITDYYRNHGYPFARAFIPAQPMTDGSLKIEVVEGKYGVANAVGSADQTARDESLTARAQAYLSPLKPGSVIESRQLERVTLILDDLPGIKAVPVIRPGQDVGSGDLNVKIERDSRVGGDVSVDNYGSRYTGRNRARANVHIDSPFTLGDQITASGLYTEENMWLGSLGYSLPLGSKGLRGNVSYAHTYYELGKDFTNLAAHGTAKVSTAGLSYPLMRSQQANLTVAANYQYKDLNDRQDVTSSNSSKNSNSLPITLNFDVRDTLGSGGITYGGIGWTHGNLKLDSALKATDQSSARTEGSFNKINLDLVRLQALPANFTLFGRVSAQWAGNNLDSSESFGLGGSSGVRAYPSGEGYGDEGWLGQLELRYNTTLANAASVSPYAFYDSGRLKINHTTWDNSVNHRTISGAGLGMRAGFKKFSADASLAWRTHGGIAQSDTKHETPMAWLTAGYRF
jgi:hemolysin activation/secretion protein